MSGVLGQATLLYGIVKSSGTVRTGGVVSEPDAGVDESVTVTVKLCSVHTSHAC